MKWKKYTIYTTTEAEDLISMMLAELGVEGVQIEDNVPLSEADTKGMFVDILPELPPDDGSSKVSFFLREEEDGNAGGASGKRPADDSEDRSYKADDRIWSKAEIEELLSAVRDGLSGLSLYSDIGEGRIEIGETQDTDWMNNWKQYFKPFLVEDMLIKPSWEEIPDEYRDGIARGTIRLIEMDPGTAFGTGSHETTQLCMKMLKKYVKSGDAVLDIGTGSGILGIAALKLGAASVTATDLDEVCEAAIAENLAANRIPSEKFRLLIGNILGDPKIGDAVGYGSYDVVAANILAPVICLLAAPGAVDRHIREGGVFITSGIINTKEDEVRAAFEKNPAWEILELNHQGEWVNVTARRKSS